MENSAVIGAVIGKNSDLVSGQSGMDGIKPRGCARCGKEFIRHGRQKYCGGQRVKGSCSYIAQLERSRLSKRTGRPANTPRICLSCGKDFIPTSRCQKYCGKQDTKGTCSYLRNLNLMREWRNNPKNKENHKAYLRERWAKFRNSQEYKTYLEERKAEYCRLRFKILDRDNFTCQYCGRSAPEVVLQIDHRFPKHRGGKRTMENLITACKQCNVGKSDLLLTEPKWAGRVSREKEA